MPRKGDTYRAERKRLARQRKMEWRKVWRTVLAAPKSPESRGFVFVAPPR